MQSFVQLLSESYHYLSNSSQTISLLLAASFACTWFHINHGVSWSKCFGSVGPFESGCCRLPMGAYCMLTTCRILPATMQAKVCREGLGQHHATSISIDSRQFCAEGCLVLLRNGSRPSAEGLAMTYAT